MPIRSVAALVAAVHSGQRVRYLHFWGHRPQRDGSVGAGCLSQWWPAPCGARHEDAPLSYRTHAPVYWSDTLAADDGSDLTPDLCVIRGEHFFVQGNLNIPLLDAEDHFSWGVWVSLSAASFGRTMQLWETPGRESEPPYSGWLSTELPVYGPTTVNLKTHVHTQPVGVRPQIEVEPTDHPLAVAQRTGVTVAEVRRVAERLLHPERHPRTGRVNGAFGRASG